MSNEQYSNISNANKAINNQRLHLDNLKLDKGPITYKEYLEIQKKIILSDENKEEATSAIGHELNSDELAQYYISSGQAAKFHKENWNRVIQKKAS